MQGVCAEIGILRSVWQETHLSSSVLKRNVGDFGRFPDKGVNQPYELLKC